MPRANKINFSAGINPNIRFEPAEFIIDSNVVGVALNFLDLHVSEEDFNVVKYWLQGVELAYWSDLQSFSGIRDRKGNLIVQRAWPTYGDAIVTLGDWKQKMQKGKFDFPDVLNTWCGATLRSAYCDLKKVDNIIGNAEISKLWGNKDAKELLALGVIDHAIRRLTEFKSPQGDLAAPARKNALKSLMGLYHVLTKKTPTHPKSKTPDGGYAFKDDFNCSTSTINRLEKSGKFPRRIKIGKRKKVWRTSEIIEWEKNQTAAENNGGAHDTKI